MDGTSHPVPSRDLRGAVHQLQEIQAWMSDYRRHEDADPLPFVGSKDPDCSAAELAAAMRGLLVSSSKEEEKTREKRKTRKPLGTIVGARRVFVSFSQLRARLSERGILIMTSGVAGSDPRNDTSRRMNPEELLALALPDPFAPLIFLNTCDTKDTQNTGQARRFSLLCALAQLLLGRAGLYRASCGEDAAPGRPQALCRAAAAELLSPHYYPATGPCGQSGGRASDSDGHTEDSAAGDSAAGDNTIRDTAITERWDRSFIRALAGSVLSGETSYTEAWRLMGMSGGDFDRLISEAG